jgi:hypothetical protein
MSPLDTPRFLEEIGDLAFTPLYQTATYERITEHSANIRASKKL